MNFGEVVATIFAATLLGILFWATMVPAPAEEQFSVANEHQHLECPAVVA
jgi:hypothetical protein